MWQVSSGFWTPLVVDRTDACEPVARQGREEVLCTFTEKPPLRLSDGILPFRDT